MLESVQNEFLEPLLDSFGPPFPGEDERNTRFFARVSDGLAPFKPEILAEAAMDLIFAFDQFPTASQCKRACDQVLLRTRRFNQMAKADAPKPARQFYRIKRGTDAWQRWIKYWRACGFASEANDFESGGYREFGTVCPLPPDPGDELKVLPPGYEPQRRKCHGDQYD